jgi:hypothetical protein
MATGKPKSGAGPYAGYKKNYSPIKSSKGTKAEKVVGKVLAAAGGGVKPQTVKVGGKTMTTKPVESGLGVVGAMAKAIARTTARNAGKDAAKATTKYDTISQTKFLRGATKATDKRRLGTAAKEYARGKAAGAKGTKFVVKQYSKNSPDSFVVPKFKKVSPTSDSMIRGNKPYSQPLIKMNNKAPVKTKTSSKNRGK